MSLVAAILLCAGLFALAVFLRQPRRCGGHCAGCVAACEREVPQPDRPARRISRGHLTLEAYDD